MVKHSQTICWLLPTNYLSVFDDIVGLVPKGLIMRMPMGERSQITTSAKISKYQ